MLVKVHDWVDASLIEGVKVFTRTPVMQPKIYHVAVCIKGSASSWILPEEYATWEEACEARDAFAESVNAALKSPA